MADRNKPWAAVTWEKCKGMNSDKKKCAAGKRHISHKKHWLGGWYGMLSHKDKRDLGYGENGPRPKPGPKKNSRGVWKW